MSFFPFAAQDADLHVKWLSVLPRLGERSRDPTSGHDPFLFASSPSSLLILLSVFPNPTSAERKSKHDISKLVFSDSRDHGDLRNLAVLRK